MKQIYCDLDGVLCDFDGRLNDLLTEEFANPRSEKIEKLVKKISGKPPLSKQELKRDKNLRKLGFYLIAKTDGFWEHLDWTKDGKRLWNYIKDKSPKILSSQLISDSKCPEEKVRWCVRELKVPPSEVIIEINKWKYAGPHSILIDDTPKKVDPFIDKGGLAILHKKTSSTIRELERILSF